jgi:hypothetical protein
MELWLADSAIVQLRWHRSARWGAPSLCRLLPPGRHRLIWVVRSGEVGPPRDQRCDDCVLIAQDHPAQR